MEILNNLSVSSDNIEDESNSSDNQSPKSHQVSENSNEEEKREIILDIPLDKEVLNLSIKAMDKLVNFFNPTNSVFDNASNPIYQFK